MKNKRRATFRLARLLLERKRGLFSDFVPDYAAYRRTAYRSECASSGKYVSANGSDAGSDSRIFLLPCHILTPTQAEQYQYDDCANGKILKSFHG
jgi:hypothetical protein